MDTFDFSTVYMAILTSNLLLAIIAVIIRNEKIMINAGYRLITIFLMLTAFRFMLPFEVPFATTVPLQQGISSIIIEIFVSRFTIGKFDISIYKIVIILWVIGIAVQAYRFIRVNRMIQSYIFTYGKNVSKDSRYASIMTEIYESKTLHFPFRIFELPDIQTPFLYGFATPYILMPENFKYSDKELTYILKHEMMHYKHHDLWIKFGTQLLAIIYWWNPFSYLLNSQVNLVLEMRIDDTVTGVNETDTLEYLQCLYRMAEFQSSVIDHKMGNVITFSHCDENKLTKRFQMLMQKKHKKHSAFHLILIGFVCCIYLFSYLFIFEADYFIPTVEETVIRVDEINSFIINNGDGTYDLYYGNIRLDTLDSLEYYDKSIPVYTMEEYEHVQQEKLD